MKAAELQTRVEKGLGPGESFRDWGRRVDYRARDSRSGQDSRVKSALSHLQGEARNCFKCSLFNISAAQEGFRIKAWASAIRGAVDRRLKSQSWLIELRGRSGHSSTNLSDPLSGGPLLRSQVAFSAPRQAEWLSSLKSHFFIDR
ncbi:hypothetical protein HAX54_033385 [Datura stramonium]|uniref:Uncharacterized protein n=1 Tax=Datura stramonium TaxID=4076 RepID=A0ABS8VDL4_DATST|nr:hypothetical protein [Datura stramonium]